MNVKWSFSVWSQLDLRVNLFLQQTKPILTTSDSQMRTHSYCGKWNLKSYSLKYPLYKEVTSILWTFSSWTKDHLSLSFLRIVWPLERNLALASIAGSPILCKLVQLLELRRWVCISKIRKLIRISESCCDRYVIICAEMLRPGEKQALNER